MSEYKVQFEVFEGPLDLLLYLIKKEEVDIYEVNLTKLASQFIEYVDLMRQFDLEVAGEFLVMASTLMYIKSRELLPKDQQVAVEEEDEGEDPRFELIRQLVEYKKFKDAAAQLQTMEERQENIYPRVPGKIEFESEAAAAKPEVGIFELLNAVNSILKRFAAKEAGTREIYEDKWTVSEKIEFVRNLITERGSVKFSQLFESAANRAEIVCTFLALLELIRMKQLACLQPEPFAEIEISKAVAPAPQPAEETPAAVAEAEVPQAIAAAEEAEPVAEKTVEEAEAEEATESEETESEETESEEDEDEDDEDEDEDEEEDEADEDEQK
jgi:segregation and condensation protein A